MFHGKKFLVNAPKEYPLNDNGTEIPDSKTNWFITDHSEAIPHGFNILLQINFSPTKLIQMSLIYGKLIFTK